MVSPIMIGFSQLKYEGNFNDRFKTIHPEYHK